MTHEAYKAFDGNEDTLLKDIQLDKRVARRNK
jgi:hypothetical protein